ncbi:MAG: DNA-directed RNA polymerase subunit delta [Bacilli bacterium]
MKIKDMSLTELELLSHCDLTSLLLKEKKKPMNTAIIFKEICKLLGYSEDDFTNKIGEFYTSLTTDKRFVLLDTAEWDLRDNHSIKISIEDDEEDVNLEEVDEEVEPEEEDIEDAIDDEELDVDDDDDEIEDFTIVDEEEIDLN